MPHIISPIDTNSTDQTNYIEKLDYDIIDMMELEQEIKNIPINKQECQIFHENILKNINKYYLNAAKIITKAFAIEMYQNNPYLNDIKNIQSNMKDNIKDINMQMTLFYICSTENNIPVDNSISLIKILDTTNYFYSDI